MRRLGIWLLAFFLVALSLPHSQAQGTQKRFHVVLLTARKDAFWTMFANITQAAADDLNIELEWLPAMNDHNKQLADALAVLKRTHNKPDALIYKNFNGTAEPILKAAEAAGVYSMMFEEALPPDISTATGRPREKYRYWLGNFIPDNSECGHEIAQQLIHMAKRRGLQDEQGRLQMVIFGGNMDENSSGDRIHGSLIALQKYPEVLLHEIVAGFWKEPIAYEKTKRLLAAYPDTDIILALNDTMAIGARKAIDEMGLEHEVLIGGIGTTPPAAIDLADGRTQISVGGQFLTGAFTLVLLHDYLHGLDFAEESTMMSLGMFPFNRSLVQPYAQAMRSHKSWEQIDFRRFSKVYNPEMQHYHFGFQTILEQLQEEQAQHPA